MHIDLKGRNVPVTDDLQRHAIKRFRKVSRQVSELARLEIELSSEKNPSIPTPDAAEVTLYLKGVTLRASDSGRDHKHAINFCEEELSRQVKRHREKRRKRRESRAAAGRDMAQPT